MQEKRKFYRPQKIKNSVAPIKKFETNEENKTSAVSNQTKKLPIRPLNPDRIRPVEPRKISLNTNADSLVSSASSPRRRPIILGGIGGGGRYEPSEREMRRARKGPEALADDDVFKEVVEGRAPKKLAVKKTGAPVIDSDRFINRALVIEEDAPYISKNQFVDFDIHQTIKDNIISKGYIVPTAIQDQTIIHALEGRDIIGIANTGEGKTAAFLIPMLNKLMNNSHSILLVVTPTRELAVQIEQEFNSFSKNIRINSALLVGGQSIVFQTERLKRGARVVIGTPGRLKDHIEKGNLNMAYVHNFVLDEADRMLDMGFVNDIRFLISKMPDIRQTLFFSATFAKEIEQLANSFLHNPVKISVKKQETNKNVDQDVVYVADKNEKFHKLTEILSQKDVEKVLVFGRTKHGVDKLGRILFRSGFSAVAIHGDKTQRERLRALKDFKENKAKILVATDVAARGLDIPDVSHVINYDAPENYDDYVHRIGRTGRAGKKGSALTFIEQ